MRFTTPMALIWLMALPFLGILGWPTRGLGRNRESISLLLRIIICFSLILALAGLEFKNLGQNNSLAVVFLLDVSDSMPQPTIQAALNVILDASQKKHPDDQVALIVFGQDALVEKTMSTVPILNGLSSIPVTTQSNLSGAVHLALALFPPGAARRIVIISDGGFTTGNSIEALQVAAASEVEIVVLPLISQPDPEILVQEISVAPRIQLGDHFDLSITLNANYSDTAEIRVFADGNMVYEGVQDVEKGLQTFSLPLIAEKSGFLKYEVSISSVMDQYLQNNQLSTYSQILGTPSILMVSPSEGESLNSQGDIRPDETTPLRDVFENAGFEVDQVIPEFFPVDLPSIAGYSSVVFVDVPAKRLTTSQMEILQSYVRDLGGGLVVVGGPTSYGVGGYYKTPLEEILPVDMQIKDEKRRPTLAIVFIVDRSGSMSESSGGPTKLELAKEAVIRSIDLLNPSDQVGVIAFDDAASWVIPVEALGDGNEAKNKTTAIGIGGGTDILAGIQTMAAVFPNVDAGSRHVILLTDGGADPTGIPELVKKLYTVDGITLSTIGVGNDAAPYLESLAVLGGGRYHFAKDPGAIPNIYSEETTLATRAYLIEEPFIPEVLTETPILEGIKEFPELLGYVRTSVKNAAQTILVSDKGDPILAAWRYGIGKVVAFTSDASGHWAKPWLSWQDYPVFWSQILQYSVGNELITSLDIQTEYQNGILKVMVDAGKNPNEDDTNGFFLNDYEMEANIINPSGTLQVAKLSQVAPGKYETQFKPDKEGVYLIKVVGTPPNLQMPEVAESAGWTMDYSPEYRQLDRDPSNLTRMALQVGGRLAEENPSSFFQRTLKAPGVYNPAWPWLLLSVIFLLPLDIALRRLTITRSDIQRIIRQTKELFGNRPKTIGQTIYSSTPIQDLLNVKQKSENYHDPWINDLQPSKDMKILQKPGIENSSLAKLDQLSSSPQGQKQLDSTNNVDDLQESPISRLLEKKRSSHHGPDSKKNTS